MADLTSVSGPNDGGGAQAALEESKRKLDAAAQLARLGYWEHDLVTNRVHWTEDTGRVLGVAAGDQTRSWNEFVAMVVPDDRRLVADCRARVLAGEARYRTAFRVQAPDGVIRYVESIGEVMRDENGRPIRMVGAIQDITEQQRLADQYRHSQKMQALGQLAGGIAHDFNNLLVVIDGYADFISDELGPSHRVRADLDGIRTAARSGAALTRQLLAFSRRQILQPQMIDLNDVLLQMKHMLGRVLGSHIRLAMDLSASERVLADRGQIEQVIMNLVVNARDAMPDGGQLRIDTADARLDATSVAQHRGTAVGPHVVLSVGDTGIGMNEMIRAHMFEPFFTTKEGRQGTGLGLATVYGIVQQSGGSIAVDSEQGIGSTFKIYLPVAAVRPSSR